MEIRTATFEDCDALGAAMQMVVDEGRWLATESATAAELANRYRTLILESDPLFVLEDGGAIVGTISLHATRTAGVSALGMWVLPTHRGRGGGRMLLEAALAGRPDEVHKIELEVFPENQPAVRLYRSMGFEEEGLRRDHYRRADGSLRSALIMARLF